MTTKSANKILIIDDDSDILDFLMDLLEGKISVSFASNGAQGIELAKLHKPDMILLDVMMPEMDGFEVCKRIKEDPEIKHIPIAFLTAQNDEKAITKGLELGAIDYITKPFDPDIVAAKVENFLKTIDEMRAVATPEAQRAGPQPGQPDRRGGGGGGYAWYTNSIPFESTDSDIKPDEAQPSYNLTEKDIQSVISESDNEQSTSSPSATSSDTASCGDLPKVKWWGNASHASIIAYVNVKNSGDWPSYIQKWERQLTKLREIFARGGTVIAPKVGTRLTGPSLSKYVSDVEKRVNITRCLAEKMQGS